MNRSVLRWAGSKRKLLPYLLQCVPTRFGTYIEPFAGSACLFFALQPDSAVLGDFNTELIHTYEVIRAYPERIAHHLAAHKTDAATYLAVRASKPYKLGSIARAVRFIYLNRLCFNGVYRTNRDGQFNVPMGKRTGPMPTVEELVKCAATLQSAELYNFDFEVTLGCARRDDFVYIDPPYATKSRPAYGEYGYGSFQEVDVVRLAECAQKLDRIGATVLISYAESRSLREALPGWHIRRLTVQRNVAASAKHRKQSPEVLISNRALPKFR